MRARSLLCGPCRIRYWTRIEEKAEWIRGTWNQEWLCWRKPAAIYSTNRLTVLARNNSNSSDRRTDWFIPEFLFYLLSACSCPICPQAIRCKCLRNVREVYELWRSSSVYTFPSEVCSQTLSISVISWEFEAQFYTHNKTPGNAFVGAVKFSRWSLGNYATLRSPVRAPASLTIHCLFTFNFRGMKLG